MDNHEDIKENSLEREKLDIPLFKRKNLSHYLKLGIEAVFTTFERFPLTLLLFLALAIIIIYRIEVPYQDLERISELLDRLTAVFSLGILFSLSVTLLLEKFRPHAGLIVRLGSYVAEIILLYLYFLFLLPDQHHILFLTKEGFSSLLSGHI